ncbi:MAG: HD domain-containing protein [Cyanobacteria bacterium NC_groundwater_1444_Ag_S-0.65um_54_12]|nr:HD domain-containing protein [Cyanobacteria bacterium NC_groundwater_1444_Ag_S-0.65um_54_12]
MNEVGERWRLVAKLSGELERRTDQHERLLFLYDTLKSLLKMQRVRLFTIQRPLAELSSPGRNRLPFFEYLAMQRQPVLISNIEAEGLALPPEIQDWHYPTLLFIPLISREVALGILLLASQEVLQLDKDEGELIMAIVPIVTSTLEVATLEQAVSRQERYTRLLDGIDTMIRTKTLPEILGTVATEVHQALETERTLIFSRRGNDDIEIATGIGCPYAAHGQLSDDACGRLAKRVALTGKVEVRNFNGILELGLARPLCLERQVVAVPIATSERVYGVLECFNWSGTKDFEGHQIALLEQLAARMALAIANSELLVQVHQAGIDAVKGLATALDAKDTYTASHSQNVGEYSYRIAVALGLEPQLCERLRLAGILHDLGKIGIPDQILNKPGGLTPEEFQVICSHPTMTSKILRHFRDLADVRVAAGTHHERWDGSGYPYKLQGEAIPLGGRIICLADAFDTLTSDRKYRSRLPLADALREIRHNAGRHFDPVVVDGLFRALGESGELDLNGNRLPSVEELEKLRVEPLG